MSPRRPRFGNATTRFGRICRGAQGALPAAALALGLWLASAGVAGCAPSAGAAAWPPAEYAETLKQQPKTELDGTIRELIAGYEERIARLKPSDRLVKAGLGHLHEALELLYREYNRNHGRYPRDSFTAAECIDWVKQDLDFYLGECLEKGIAPAVKCRGRWQGRAYWIERADILGRYPKSLVRLENKTRSILKAVAREFNIDPFRVYATGFSYGGRTDLIFAWRYPHWFAAIAPVCNDLRNEQTPYVKQLKNVPTLLLHGDRDSFLRTGKQVHAYMVEAGCPVTFRTYKGGHDSTVPFLRDLSMLTDFFDRHRMDPYPKLVSHIVEHKRYSRAFWVDAKLTKDSGRMEAIFEVRVRQGNRIEIEANEQIAELDLYLNEKLIDMSKPVTVLAGGKTLYQGPPRGKLTVKLREAPDYARDGGDALWEDLLKIRAGKVLDSPHPAQP